MPSILSPVLLWFLAGILCFITELLAPGFVVFFFGLGAWCTALVVWLVPVSLSVQLLVFLASSLIALFLLRTWIRTVFIGRNIGTDAPADGESVGSLGVVVEAIRPPASGRVKCAGSFWQAVADQEIDEGTVVFIEEQTNLQVRVRPARQGEGS